MHDKYVSTYVIIYGMICTKAGMIMKQLFLIWLLKGQLNLFIFIIFSNVTCVPIDFVWQTNEIKQISTYESCCK